MSTRLIAVAAILSIAGLAAASLAGATTPSGGSSGGGVSAGGGGGGHAGGGGSGGGHFSSGGGHFGGGHFGGGFRGGAYGGGRGYGGGGYAVRASYLAHGGYIAHGSSLGFGPHSARGGYRIVGTESAGIAGVSAMPRSGHDARITLALGPRTGSAASAMRLGHMDRIQPRPGHPPRPIRPGHHPKHVKPSYPSTQQYGEEGFQPFCDDIFLLPTNDHNDQQRSGCLAPVKEQVGRKIAVAMPIDPSRVP